MLKFIRIMLAIAAYHDYEILQMDVKTIFFNGNLEKKSLYDSAKEIYLKWESKSGMQAQ